MAAKVLTQIFTGHANLAALEIAIDTWLDSSVAVVIDVHINDAGTDALIFYYA